MVGCGNIAEVREVKYPDGNIKSRQSYAMGKPEGFIIGYYENGSMSDSSSIRNGQYDGVSKGFYEDGSLKSLEYYKKGSVEGRKVLYYPNGKIFVEEYYKQGVRNGTQKTYDSDNNLWRECDYENGKVSGDLKIFYHGNHIKKRFIFNHGDVATMREVYYLDGKVKLRTYYDPSGGVVKEIRFDEGGNELPADSLIVHRIDKLKGIKEGDTITLRINFVYKGSDQVTDKHILLGQVDEDDSLYVEKVLPLGSNSYITIKKAVAEDGKVAFAGALEYIKDGKKLQIPFIWWSRERSEYEEIWRAKRNF